MNRRELLEAALLATASAGLVSSADAHTHTPGGVGGKVTPLQSHALAGSNGQQVVMVEVAYPPGGSTPAHKHSGPVFGYVLEGSVVFRLDDGPEKTYRAGEVFHEEPGQVHAVSRNASRKKPARILAVIIGPQDEPVTTLLK
jgi:quercetin dioxygenase-like cupin family protein